MFDFDVVTDSPETVRLQKPAAQQRRAVEEPAAAPPPATSPQPTSDVVPGAAD